MAMMDVIVLPKRIGTLYSEIFQEFPEISGIYIRFGETYVGEKYGTPYHFGSHPIWTPEDGHHLFLIGYLKETVCQKYQRNLYYRTWGFSQGFSV